MIFARLLALYLLGALVASPGRSAGEFVLAAFGDSLMAGYGLPAAGGFVPRMEKRLRAEGLAIRVTNFAVSGNTSADALRRVTEVIAAQPDAVIVCFGGNDALRAIKPAEVERNLAGLLARFDEADIPVFLSGMSAPTNWGPLYKIRFDDLFDDLADDYDVAFDPFFLADVALVGALNQVDGIHPNERGVVAIVERLGPLLADFVRDHS